MLTRRCHGEQRLEILVEEVVFDRTHGGNKSDVDNCDLGRRKLFESEAERRINSRWLHAERQEREVYSALKDAEVQGDKQQPTE